MTSHHHTVRLMRQFHNFETYHTPDFKYFFKSLSRTILRCLQSFNEIDELSRFSDLLIE